MKIKSPASYVVAAILFIPFALIRIIRTAVDIADDWTSNFFET